MRLGSSYWFFAPEVTFLRPHWRSGVNSFRYFAHLALLAHSGPFWILWPHLPLSGPYGALGPICPFWAFFGTFFRALRPIGLTGPKTLLAWGRLRRIGKTSLDSYFTAPYALSELLPHRAYMC